MPEVGSGPRDSRSHPGSITQQVLPAVIALLVAVSALGVGLIRGSSGPTIFVTATQYGNDAAYCESVSSPGCQLAPAGATWTIPPISSRCTVNGPPGSGLNVPNPPGPTECASWTISFGFNTTDELGVTGMLSTTGPIQVWILPGQD